MWTSMEWLGTFLALNGTFIMATKKINAKWAWLSWLISNLTYIVLFGLHTHQYGLLFMNTGGFLINSLGLWQWLENKKVNPHIEKSLSYLSMGCLVMTLIVAGYCFSEPELKKVEWIGSLLALSASLLLASKHVYWYLCWVLWFISNLLLLGLCTFTHQWGLLTLQLGFTLMNAYAILTSHWFYHLLKKIK